MGLMAVPRVAPRAGASPAPTIYGWASHSCMVGATLAVALQAGRGQFLPGRGQTPPLPYTVGRPIRVW